MMAAPTTPAPAELDEFTLARAKRGDEDACRALFDRYRRPVYATVSRLLSDRGRIDDVAQDTFLRVFDALPRFSPSGPAKLSTWILTIAIRLCRDEARKHKRRKDAPLPEWVAQQSLAADAPVQRRQQVQAVDTAIRDLPEGMREAVVLCCVQGLSTQDCADILGVEPGTVKSRVSRGREKLRRTLSEVRDG